MADEHPDALEPAPEGDQHERVRRLLAEARHEGPVPADVAARIDAALARLVDERAQAGAQPDELAARRRRKRWGTVLAAAAAAVVVGVGAPNLGLSLNAGSGDADSSGAGGVAADSADRNELLEPEEDQDGGAGAEAGTPYEVAPSESSLVALPVVTAERFRRDVLDARASFDHAEPPARRHVCGEVPSGAAQVVLVVYDDGASPQPGYLVFEAAASEAGRQLVTLFVCPGGVPVRSLQVPVS